MSDFKLFNGDCLEIMKNIPDKSIDMIITSPPYNIGNMHSNKIQYGTYAGNNMNERLYQEWQLKFLNECFRILKNEGSLFYNHKIRIKNGVAIHPMQWILKSNFLLKQEITWDMAKSANCDKIRFFPFSERIYWLVKDKTTKLNNNLNLSDVWRILQTHKRSDTKHIAVMPEKIVENILMSFENNKTILDPFMGSGTTGVVCKRLNRNFIGIELNKKYFEIAKKRIENPYNDGQVDTSTDNGENKQITMLLA